MKYLKTGVRLSCLLIISCLIGIILLWCSFLLPDRWEQNHIADSANIFSREGLEAEVGNSYSEKLDNWTDALMVGSACYHKEGAGALERAAAIYRPDYMQTDPIESLEAYAKSLDGVKTVSYPRYWHGYLILLRPLLMITDYSGVRMLNTEVFILAILLLSFIIWKRKRFSLFLPLGMTIFFLRPMAIVHSLQFSTVFYPMILSVMACIYFESWFCRSDHFVDLFFINGVLIAYFDLLTYPAASLGVLLTVWTVMRNEDSLAEKIRQITLSSVAWGIGYFGMWCGKWLISSVILHQNVFADALSQAQVRVSSSYGENHFSRLMVFARNIGAGFIGILAVSALIFIVLSIFMIWKRRERWKYFREWYDLGIQMMPYLLICLIPFAWYSVFVNHSYIHIKYTYRTLAASVCSWTAMCIVLGGKRNNMSKNHQKTQKNMDA